MWKIDKKKAFLLPALGCWTNMENNTEKKYFGRGDKWRKTAISSSIWYTRSTCITAPILQGLCACPCLAQWQGSRYSVSELCSLFRSLRESTDWSNFCGRRFSKIWNIFMIASCIYPRWYLSITAVSPGGQMSPMHIALAWVRWHWVLTKLLLPNAADVIEIQWNLIQWLSTSCDKKHCEN